MAYEDDEIRREAARRRLEERMRRNGTSSASSQSTRVLRREQPVRSTQESRAQGSSVAASVLGDGRLRPVIVVALVAVVLVVLLVVVVLPTCSGGSALSGSSSQSTASSTSAASSASDTSTASDDSSGEASANAQSETPKQEELNEILGDEAAAKLIDQAKSSDDALWIAAHPEAFAFDGPEVQAKVLKLAADDPLAISFVRNFPDQYPNEKPTDDQSLALDSGSPSADVPSTRIPHLYQWDRRWGYTEYNADAFGLSGCGPTSLAMVYQGLTGKTDRTPYDMGQLAYEGNYVVEWLGTANDFFTDSANDLGLKCEVLSSSADDITKALSSGKAIVANLGVGTFTSYGHFFVLAGLDDNGKIIVNDPYSATRSSQTWDPELIASESVALYAYSAS